MITRLEWDSDFFGYEIGLLKINSVSDFDLDFFIQNSSKFKLIYIFSDFELSNPLLKLVDKKVTFHKYLPVTYKDLTLSDIKLTLFNEKLYSIKELRKLALESGVYSRFRIDQKFTNNEYERLYLKWIENAILRQNSNIEINIAVDNYNKILGFTTLSKKNNHLADIGLVAVHEEQRGKGIGSLLLHKTQQNAHELGFEEIQVVTQLDNIGAVNLYKKNYFEIKDIKYIYHLWNL